MSQATILVTGASGFLGGHTVKALLAKGYRVRALTRQGRSIPGSETLIVENYLDPSSLGSAMGGVDVVVHLAGLAHVPPWRRSWVAEAWERRMEKAHVRPAEVLAEAARRQGVRRFVFISSLAAQASVSEEAVGPATPPRPAGAYGRAKLRAEICLRQICGEGDMQLVTLRPPMIYGRGGPGNPALLAAWIRRGWPVPVPIQANPRSLLYLGNFLSILTRIVEAPEVPAWPVLVQDDRALTTEELVVQIGRAVGRVARCWKLSPTEVRFLGAFTGGFLSEKLCGRLTVDSTSTELFYQWKPPTKAEEGIFASFAPLS